MENKKEMRSWLDDFKLNHPLVIAGPCSAETEDQVLKIAHDLKNTDVSIYRAGIWKPRTRPGMFEGVGAIGLKWLDKVKKETGLLTATEVANASHVKLALEYDIDVLWIGARSTVSPFIVQEIADALKDTDKIVLVKNPVNPDLSLWLGGLERLYSSNIKKLGVIHRGFSTYEKSKYRNNPEWQLPIELQNRFPDIPLICDPSHIAGRRDILQDISQTALDLNFDGLMIETHIDPDNAWSDAAQQITPEVLVQMMEDLKIRKETDIPLVLMTYTNILHRMGYEKFIKDAKKAGVDGFILPDMSIEESKDYLHAAKNNADTIFLISPNTSKTRIEKIAKASTGFLYLVAVFGTSLATRNNREPEPHVGSYTSRSSVLPDKTILAKIVDTA